MLECDIGLVDGAWFNFNQSFLQFNAKKKVQVNSSSSPSDFK